ncbi:hypothetical protein AB0G02_00430 [Actinosynnema sp. NPDC023658]|uniref:hypothetical protein n=1 Tax=Actinosynnema sp. NPDC023658 TaxID=3155465 RepID=UPI0033E11706
MRSIIRLAAAGALALPLIIGAAGIASADAEYDQNNAAATANGASVHDQASGVDDYGNSYYFEEFQFAGPDGAGSWAEFAATWDGNAYYFDAYAWSGPEGAYTGDTQATAESPDYYDDDDYDYDDDYDHHDDYGDDDYDDYDG